MKCDQAVFSHCSFEKKRGKGFRVHLFEPVNESGRCRRFFFCFARGCAEKQIMTIIGSSPFSIDAFLALGDQSFPSATHDE